MRPFESGGTSEPSSVALEDDLLEETQPHPLKTDMKATLLDGDVHSAMKELARLKNAEALPYPDDEDDEKLTELSTHPPDAPFLKEETEPRIVPHLVNVDLGLEPMPLEEKTEDAEASTPIEEDGNTQPAFGVGSDMSLGEGVELLAEATREFRFSDLPLVDRTFGPFQITEHIGKGGFASVYKATHQNNQREVAIKVLNISQQTQPKTIERFQREAESMARLRHPGVIQFYDFGELEDVGFYLVMEYFHGVGLDTLMKPHQSWPMKHVQQVIEPLCDALAYIHEHNIIHRDLKPSNIMVSGLQGEAPAKVKLLDFGIAGFADGRSELTSDGTFLGTAQYVSPEQARGKKSIDHRTDLYSLGVILFRLLAGQLPYDAAARIDIVIKHLHQPTPTLAEVAPWKNWADPLETFLQMALAKEPDQRPKDAETFKRLCLNAIVTQSAIDKDGQTLIQKHGDYASQDDLAAYIANHGEMPGASSSTMRLDLSNTPLADLSLHQLGDKPPLLSQWKLFVIAFAAGSLLMALLVWLFGLLGG